MRVGTVLIRSLAAVLISLFGVAAHHSSPAAQPVQIQVPESAGENGASSAGETPGEGDAKPDAAQAGAYISAVDLLPPSTAGVVRIPKLPSFCDAWRKTQIGQLIDSPEMQPFIDDQRERAASYMETLDRKIGVKPDDLYKMASGEVAVAWMSHEEDKRRPYSLCVVADIRGKKKDADDAAEKIDADLKAGGATRKDVEHGKERIRVYRTKPKPGQLKIEEIVLTWNDHRFIAADRQSVVTELLDVLDGKLPQRAFSDRESYKKVISDSSAAITQAKEENATVCWEWYAQPFAMGRILRELFEYDRRDDLDIIDLLERQGFGVIDAAGGVGVVSGERFDILHRGIVLTSGKLTKAARMLQGANAKRGPIPGWPTSDSGTFYRLNWDLESAFWATESLVDDALGDDLFRPMIEGIRDDPEGPRIDIAKDFLPNLDDEVILVTDNTTPIGPESDRMLIALKIKNADVVAGVVEKAMKVEPDATKLDVAEFDVWRVERGEGEVDDIDAQLKELGFEDQVDDEEVPPLLNHWAIAVVKGNVPGAPDYLMFSSHSELLIKLGMRVRSGVTGDGLESTDQTKTVVKAMDDLKADEVTFDGVFHPSISLRARYELLRKGELKDSDSVIANLLRRIVQEGDEGKPDPIQAGKLPPFATINRYLKSGGSFWQKTEDGWSMTGFLMAK
ncbi:MAG: hypothetical protein KDB00_01380 [Planctomycetales bacterium]|nr:hypothetical protein [Planctomycetales bacterium]